MVQSLRVTLKASVTTFCRRIPMSEATRDATSQPYSGFDRMPIGGDWRMGKADRTLKDFDPYTGQAILEIPQCIGADLDMAYECAARTQVAWGQALPSMRATVLRRVPEIMKSPHHLPFDAGQVTGAWGA
jgi:hypothetical protein